MNGKEQIAAVLAHEVKNPVSLIKMNVQYIAQKLLKIILQSSKKSLKSLII